MPMFEAFRDAESYHATLAHETTHWTSHASRLARDFGSKRFGSEACACGPRIVRVGTHALKAGSGTKLWTRLSQHKGQPSTGGGNHRGSIFRLIVGAALAKKHRYDFPTWGRGNTAKGDIRKNELALEKEVSAFIGKIITFCCRRRRLRFAEHIDGPFLRPHDATRIPAAP